MGISIRHGSDFVAINRLENVRCGRCGRQRDVQWRPWWMAVNGCEWLWMALNRDSWWADGLGCNENVEFISVMILAENLMNDWNHLILSCLNSLNFSLFFGQECSPHRTNRVCQKGTMVRKCRCYMKYIEVWSCLATGEPECTHVSTMKKVAFFGLSSRQKKPVIFGQDAGAAFIPQRRTRRHFRSSVQWLCSNWRGWFGGEFSWMP